MDISPLADKQQRNRNRQNSRHSHADEQSRLDDTWPLRQSKSTKPHTTLSVTRILQLIDELNQMTGSVDVSFEMKDQDAKQQDTIIVEIVDSRQNELLMELDMQDLIEIEKQLNEDSIENLTEFMCGSFFSLTAWT